MDAELRFTYVEVPGGHLAGLPQASLIGKSIWSVFHGALRPSVYAGIKSALAASASARWEVCCGGATGNAYLEFHAFPSRGGLAIYFQDITERKGAQDEWLRYFTLSPDGLCILDRSFAVQRVNPAWERMLGFAPEEMSGRPIFHFVHPDDIAATRDTLLTATAQPPASSALFENRCRSKSGGYRWLQWSISLCPDGDLCYATTRDVTESKEAEATIRWRANHDELTGLPNRALFQDRLGQALAAARRRETCVALLFLDLDDFKRINDTLGHDAGDHLLEGVSKRLAVCLRDEDTLSRIGGDEFVVILPHITGPDDAVKVAQKLIHALESPFPLAGHDLNITSSIGISVAPFDGLTPETLFKNADVAMYRAKHEGRGGYALYNPAMNANAMEQLVLESRLSQAVGKRELLLHYQPQVSFTSGQMIGVEALMRWRHHELGMVSPSRFIPVAEETGLIVPMGNWAFQEACRQAAEWRRIGHPLSVSINLSARQLADEHLPELLLRFLTEAGVPPHVIDLELTEGTFINNDGGKALSILSELKSLGVRLSVDDFGTGYSSLAYLRRFPVDMVKVDRSFITHMVEDAADEAVVRAVIDLSHTLGLSVTAEGVETAAQHDKLRDLGCDVMQGHFFSPAVPAKDVAGLVSASRG